MEITATTSILSETAVATEIDGFTIATEPPVAAGGSGAYPPATRLVLAALLNCSFSGLKSFCAKRSIPMDGLSLTCHGIFEDGIYSRLSLHLSLPTSFPDKYKGSIGHILDTCAVKKIIHNLPEMQFELE